jgi:hypothetical protein
VRDFCSLKQEEDPQPHRNQWWIRTPPRAPLFYALRVYFSWPMSAQITFVFTSQSSTEWKCNQHTPHTADLTSANYETSIFDHASMKKAKSLEARWNQHWFKTNISFRKNVAWAVYFCMKKWLLELIRTRCAPHRGNGNAYKHIATAKSDFTWVCNFLRNCILLFLLRLRCIV